MVAVRAYRRAHRLHGVALRTGDRRADHAWAGGGGGCAEQCLRPTASRYPVAEVIPQSPLSDEATARGIAPADRRAHGRWSGGKIALADSGLFGVAVGSIYIIDDHVLQASPAPPTTSVTH